MKTYEDTLQWLKSGKQIVYCSSVNELRLIDADGKLTPHHFTDGTFTRLLDEKTIKGTGCYAGSTNQYYRLT